MLEHSSCKIIVKSKSKGSSARHPINPKIIITFLELEILQVCRYFRVWHLQLFSYYEIFMHCSDKPALLPLDTYCCTGIAFKKELNLICKVHKALIARDFSRNPFETIVENTGKQMFILFGGFLLFVVMKEKELLSFCISFRGHEIADKI